MSETHSIEKASDSKLTPLMKQYWEIKNAHQDKILLFRMGDFYEMFYDDAKIAAPILGIALTSRNKKSEDETPMCGVPYHSIATPIGKLLNAGLKIAICDQLEDPETAKGIVKRGVTRILSPGMIYDPAALNEKQNNYVAALDDEHLSFIDATTGESFFYTTSGEKNKLYELLSLIQPAELLLTSQQVQNSALKKKIDLLKLYVTVFSECDEVWPDRFKNLPESALRLLTYATQMQGVRLLSTMQNFTKKVLKQYLVLSATTLKHLEVFESYRGEEKGSLFKAINRTQTSSGARLLKSWLRFPLLDKAKIEWRYDQVDGWSKKVGELKILRTALAKLGDVERRLTKISYANYHPRDFIALKDSLDVGLSLTPFCINASRSQIEKIAQLSLRIGQVIHSEPPNNIKNGGYINKGADSKLDELIHISENSQQLLLQLEEREKVQTGISSLKVRYNNVFGYYIEVTNTHKDKIPQHYIRKQTLANAERYLTEELSQLENQILSSREKRTALEEEILKNLRDEILSFGRELLELSAQWSELDVITSLSWLALEQSYVRPALGTSLRLKASRHPVVEQEVKRTFVPNSLTLEQGECLLLTGPNMAGKSTIMRQVAVTAIMAQMGSFVPAATAELPLFDQIFTRIGASDSLSEGLSTFMVEMTETAEMLKGASQNTLVVLDEVGRGTSTYDGMSLAQAILEYLVSHSGSFTLFATHYHEITQLAEKYKAIKNSHMSVQEKGDSIDFLYTLKAGPASRSYGIQVARLAGVPDAVVSRAQELLNDHELMAQKQSDKWQLKLF